MVESGEIPVKYGVMENTALDLKPLYTIPDLLEELQRLEKEKKEMQWLEDGLKEKWLQDRFEYPLDPELLRKLEKFSPQYELKKTRLKEDIEGVGAIWVTTRRSEEEIRSIRKEADRLFPGIEIHSATTVDGEPCLAVVGIDAKLFYGAIDLARAEKRAEAQIEARAAQLREEMSKAGQEIPSSDLTHRPYASLPQRPKKAEIAV